MQVKTPAGLNRADVLAALRSLRKLLRRRKGRVRKSSADAQLRNLAQFESLDWELMCRGFAVSTRVADNVNTYELALRVWVSRKVAKSKLRTAQRIPSYLEFVVGNTTVRLQTDVVEMSSLPRAHRSIDARDTIAHFLGPPGTLTCAVEDSAGNRFALTCSHVAALSGRASNGDRVESPADNDSTAGVNTIGALARFTRFRASGVNTADAALVRLDNSVSVSNRKLMLAPGAAFANLTISQYLQLENHPVTVETNLLPVGGLVETIHADLPVEHPDGQTYMFSDLFSYSAQVAPGDSGSAIVDQGTRSRVLGIHIAGNGGVGYAMTSRNLLRSFPDLTLRLVAN